MYEADGKGKEKEKIAGRTYCEKLTYRRMEWLDLGWLRDYYTRNKKVRIKSKLGKKKKKKTS